MKQVILGTAGHIDHGKTTLIKALTGIDTDRLKEEKERGITIATALLSYLRGQPARNDLAMTGELTLTGQVLPVGGIREKVIAARRSKIMELILPHANRRDFEELPEYLREGINVHFARTFRDVFECVFQDHQVDKSLH